MTYDLLDDIGRRVEVDETFVDAHLVPVPSLGTLTTWTKIVNHHPHRRHSRLSGGVFEHFGGETNGAFDAEIPVLGTVDQVTADCRQKHSTELDSHFSSGLTFREVRVIRILWIFPVAAPLLSRSSLV